MTRAPGARVTAVHRLLELVIRHSGFSVRLAESAPSVPHWQQLRFSCGSRVWDLGQIQASIAPAYVAEHEQWPIGLANAPKL